MNGYNSSKKIGCINNVILSLLLIVPSSTFAFGDRYYNGDFVDNYDMEEVFDDYRIMEFPGHYNKSYQHYIDAIEANHNLALEAIEARQEVLTAITKKIKVPFYEEDFKPLHEIFIKEADIFYSLIDGYYLEELNIYNHLVYDLEDDEVLTEKIAEEQSKAIFSKDIDKTYSKFYINFQASKDEFREFCVEPQNGKVHYELCTNIYNVFKRSFINSFRSSYDISMKSKVIEYLRNKERLRKEQEFKRKLEEYRRKNQ